MTATEIVAGLGIGLVAGAASGSLGVGGGAIMVPAMVLLLGVDEATTQGTSLLVILPTALVGVASHVRHGSVNISPTWLVGVAGAAAAGGGALLALHATSTGLRTAFAVFLVIVGLRTILSRPKEARSGPGNGSGSGPGNGPGSGSGEA